MYPSDGQLETFLDVVGNREAIAINQVGAIVINQVEAIATSVVGAIAISVV